MSIARVRGLCLAALVALGCGPATPAPGEPADPSKPAEGEACSSCGTGCGPCSAPDLARDPAVEAPPVAACPVPNSYEAPVAVGTVTNTAMDEISGLATSRRSPGYLYTHNDSGDSARVFVLDAQGGFVGTFTVTGATAVDWEDAATGPCPAGSCLFVGDHGDNTARRTDCAVYRMPEPDLAGGVRGGSLMAEKFPFAYPDGPRDAESLMVHPTTGNLYIISKSLLGLSNVYRFPTPLRPGVKVTLVKVGELRLPLSVSALATAASIHPCGDRFLLRTYNRIYEYRAAPGQPFETAFRGTRTTLPAPSEPQGEAVEYRLDGMGYFTLSEGAGRPLYFVGGR